MLNQYSSHYRHPRANEFFQPPPVQQRGFVPSQWYGNNNYPVYSQEPNPLLPNPSTSGAFPNIEASPFHPAQTSATHILSKHLLQQDILKNSIGTFDGESCNFWPWIGKVKSYIHDLNLTPLQTLQLLQAHSSKGPNQLITNSLASAGEITPIILQEVWKVLQPDMVLQKE